MANVLVTCGGGAVGMILQLQRTLPGIQALRGGGVFVADRAAMPPAAPFADAAFIVPPVGDDAYVEHLLDVCRQQAVRVVIPILDVDLERLAPHRGTFAHQGTTVVCPPPRLVDLCLDKGAFERFARREGLPHPATYEAGSLRAELFPLFAKRRRGFGAIGAGVCRSLGDAEAALARDPDLIFQELVVGPELSVDAYIAMSGRCIVRVPRVRDKVVGGEARQSHTIRSAAVADLADRTIQALARHGLRGPLNVQLFGGTSPTLLEVNTRLGSASVLSNVATGGRFFRALLREACGDAARGDPDEYDADMHLCRYFGDVMHDGLGLAAAFPGPPRRFHGGSRPVRPR